MGSKITLFLGIMIAMCSNALAETTFKSSNFQVTENDSIVLWVTGNQLKLNASDIDLLTIKVSCLDQNNEILPDILAPTSHANLYALIDFSNCMDGTYSITGYKGEGRVIYTIILKKD